MRRLFCFPVIISYIFPKSLIVNDLSLSLSSTDTIDGKRVATIPGGRKGTEKVHIGHTSHVYSIAVSSDGMFLVS